jgi:fatty acid synthase
VRKNCSILTGGLGGFGLELCNWLMSRGARKLVLVSRSGLSSGYQSLLMRRWATKTGVKIIISTTDASTLAGAQALIQQAHALAPVGGIFNLAAVRITSLTQPIIYTLLTINTFLF